MSRRLKPPQLCVVLRTRYCVDQVKLKLITKILLAMPSKMHVKIFWLLSSFIFGQQAVGWEVIPSPWLLMTEVNFHLERNQS